MFGRLSINKIKQLFYEQSPDGMMSIIDGVITDCNPACARLFGFSSREAMIGRTPGELSPETQPDGQSSASKAEACLNEALENGYSRVEWLHRHTNGSTFPVMVTLHQAHRNGQKVLLTTLTDISGILADRDRHQHHTGQLVTHFDQEITRLLADADFAVRHVGEAATEQAAISTQMNANVQTVASAAGQLSTSIHEIASHVEQAAQISVTAAEETVRTNALVEELASSSEKIGQIVQLINAIANQTNLLALNAAIEAARAGEAGKGFAVVANEVKNLASQTANATGEIISQITAVQEETKQAVDAIRHIASVIDQVRGISTSIASAVDQQGASTRQVSINIAEVAQASHGVEEAAQSTLSSTLTLNQSTDALRDEISAFLSKINSAQQQQRSLSQLIH